MWQFDQAKADRIIEQSDLDRQDALSLEQFRHLFRLMYGLKPDKEKEPTWQPAAQTNPAAASFVQKLQRKQNKLAAHVGK